ncbi:MAG: hypothetical protein J3Q66DRAFT_365211 [Benniella sp.]|nr:MAG: hypothetical protein J3Q66DRAFT_365211 [Benniella sp.]
MTKDISIFDLPHVMERVASYLDRKDRMSCTLVCRSFYNEFNRLLWRELAFHRLTSFSEFKVDGGRKEALIRNARWTWKVSVDTQCRTGVLSVLSESCTHLRDLTIFVSRKHQPDMEKELLLPIIELIARNAQLRTCTIVRYADLSSEILGKLAGAISSRSFLRELKLVFRNWPHSYPHLEVAKLLVDLTASEEPTFIQFLERCPALKNCYVPQMASMESLSTFIHLLGLKRFPFTLTKLDCRKWRDLDEYQWNRLLWAMKGDIQSFVVGVAVNTIPTRNHIREMARYWSQTLETLSIYEAHLITSPDIQLILTSCPKLKKFDCICYWLLITHQPRSDEDNPLPGLKAMVTGENDANNDMVTDWVCLEMEELKITFSDGRRSLVEEPMLTQQEQWTARGIERVYEQLGRLKKLRELTIGWCSGRTFSKDANLDMSLQSGMEHMKDLRVLRTLDVNYIARLNFGMAEAQWILQNWPELRTISGLRNRYRATDDLAPERNHIEFLNSKQSENTLTAKITYRVRSSVNPSTKSSIVFSGGNLSSCVANHYQSLPLTQIEWKDSVAILDGHAGYRSTQTAPLDQPSYKAGRSAIAQSLFDRNYTGVSCQSFTTRLPPVFAPELTHDLEEALITMVMDAAEGRRGARIVSCTKLATVVPVLRGCQELTESEEHTFSQFLERCHALKELSVPRMASMQAISNTIALLGSKRLPFTLTKLDSHMWDELSDQQWRHLLLAMKDTIRSFITGVNFNVIPTRHFIHEMTKYWSHTLEAVHIYHSHLITSSDIQLILTTCSKLKRFECICYWMLLAGESRSHDEIPLPGLKVMVGAGGDDAMADWVCLELEELKIMFSDARRPSAEEPTLSQQEECTVRGIKRAYEQLGRLKNMRKLSIGWCSTGSYSKDANLDMSLQSGLGHMKNLTLLKEIELNFIDKVNIGMAEAQWMLDNWPSLRSIAGLKRSHSMLEWNAQEPDYFALLRTERPWLAIS